MCFAFYNRSYIYTHIYTRTHGQHRAGEDEGLLEPQGRGLGAVERGELRLELGLLEGGERALVEVAAVVRDGAQLGALRLLGVLLVGLG